MALWLVLSTAIISEHFKEFVIELVLQALADLVERVSPKILGLKFHGT